MAFERPSISAESVDRTALISYSVCGPEIKFEVRCLNVEFKDLRKQPAGLDMPYDENGEIEV